MSWYRTGTVAVTNGSKIVTGVGTLWTTAISVGDAFALVDANRNPVDAFYEVESVDSNTQITLVQSYAGTTGSNNQYCVFNMVGNMTTPSFAQRLATFFDNFQELIDQPTTTPTASSIPVADSNGKIDRGWLPDATVAFKGAVKIASPITVSSGTISVQDASDTAKGVVELATDAEVLAGTDTKQAITPAGAKAVYAPLASPAFTGTPTAPTAEVDTNTPQIANTIFVNTAITNKIAVANAMVFKGTLGTGGTVTALPSSGYLVGWTYKVITAGTYAGLTCTAGDLVACVSSFSETPKNSDWVLIPVYDEWATKADITYVNYATMEGDPA